MIHNMLQSRHGQAAASPNAAVQRTEFAVDVGSGVEKEPRLKDADKLKRFFEAVRQADARSNS